MHLLRLGVNQAGILLPAHGVAEGADEFLALVTHHGLGRIDPFLEQTVHRDIVRRDLIHTLQACDLPYHLRVHNQFVSRHVPRHRLHADLEIAFVLDEEIPYLKRGAGRCLFVPHHLRHHRGGKAQSQMGSQELGIAHALLLIAVARDFRRDRHVANHLAPVVCPVQSQADQRPAIGKAIFFGNGVKLSNQRGVVQSQVGELAVELEPAGRCSAEILFHGLPEFFHIPGMSCIEFGDPALFFCIVADRYFYKLFERGSANERWVFQQVPGRQLLKSLQGLGNALFKFFRDHPLFGGLLPDPLDGFDIHPEERPFVGRQAGTEERIEERRFDASVGSGGCRPVTELIGQGGQCHGPCVPAGLVGEIGNVLPFARLL